MTPTANSRPHDHCYLIPNTRLIAGHYPGSFDPGEAREKLKSLVDFGVDYFVDVTSPDDRLTPYEEMLRDEAGERGIEYRAFPIPDMGITDSETMNRILDELDAAAEAGHTTYVHCWGGVGRTGTVVGCYLVRHGHTGDDALGEVNRLFKTTVQSSHFPEGSPQTGAQRDFVRDWARFDDAADQDGQ